MNRKLFYIAFTACLALLLSVSGAIAQDPAPEERAEPQGVVSLDALLNSRISYQGMLTENGTATNGSRDMTFRLYSDDTCTTQVGSDIVETGVTVTDGLFSVELDVNQEDFDGQELWLAVEVGSTSIGCREILPVPYALSLRPGALVVGEQIGGDVIHAHNTATSGKTTGVHGQTSSSANNAAGVRGVASATSGTTIGVHGRNDSSAGAGVYGYASANSGNTAGVFGANISTAGQGVLGLAMATSGNASGVYGQSLSAAGAGVYGSAPTTGTVGIASATSGDTVGVYGRSDSPDGTGVRGFVSAGSGYTVGDYGRSNTPDGIGVRGTAIDASGSGYVAGVYGLTNSPSGDGVVGLVMNSSGDRKGVIGSVWGSGYGLYSTNDLYVNGTCTGCTTAFIARNASQETLRIGDVVAVGGVGPLLQGHSTPVLEVHRATTGDVAVLGIVRGRGEFYAARGDQPLDNGDSVQPVAGDVAPDDYLFVVTSGLAQVRVAPGLTRLAPGQTLTVSAGTGLATLSAAGDRPGLVFAQVMEAQPDENGLIWALIGAQ